MASTGTKTAEAADGGVRALAPVLVGLALLALIVLGVILSGKAEDQFTAFAGLAFAAFGLFIGGRYFGRLLP